MPTKYLRLPKLQILDKLFRKYSSPKSSPTQDNPTLGWDQINCRSVFDCLTTGAELAPETSVRDRERKLY